MEETIFDELPKLFNYTTSTQDVIRVVIIDAKEAMREGIRQMLSEDESIKVIGESRNIKDAVSQIQKLYPDIVILGIDAESTEGIGLVKQIKQSLPNISVIILNDDHKLLVPSIENGAVAFLTRDIGRNELVSAIRIVYLWRSILFQNDDHFTLVKFN
jgi:DNA-binding NarL/FixJ family response regulator